MFGKYLCSLALLFQVGHASSQVTYKRLSFLPEIGSYLNLNGADVQSGTGNSPKIKSPIMPGLGWGLACRFQLSKRHSIIFQPTLALRVDPNRIRSDVHNPLFTDSRFTTCYLYSKSLIGVTFPVGKASALDIMVGGSFLFSLSNNKGNYKLTYSSYEDQTGRTLNYVNTYSQISWGDAQEGASEIPSPSAFLATAQVAYLYYGLFKNNHPIRIAVEFTSRIKRGKNISGRGSQGKYVRFDQDRNILSETRFEDRFRSIGLILGIGL